MWDLISAHKRLTEHLERAKVESARLCSEILLAHIMDLRRIDIYARFDVTVTKEKLDQLNAASRRRISGVPLQLVVGNTQFLSYIFAVEQGVFIPRPETEGLVDSVAHRMRALNADTPPALLDLCTGTGVIAVSLLKLLPAAHAVAIDADPAAARLTIRNAEALGVASRLTVLQGNLFEPLATSEHATPMLANPELPNQESKIRNPESGRAAFDLIISNPPYIPSDDISGLDSVVRDFDPRAALDGGADGLDIIRRILAGAPQYLKPGGLLALEFGINQTPAIEQLLRNAGFKDIIIENDLAGIPRCVFATLT